jgi:hypothetical protein
MAAAFSSALSVEILQILSLAQLVNGSLDLENFGT